MKKQNIQLLIILISIVLIILNFIFTMDEMGIGFWLRISTGIFVIIAMVFSIRDQKKKQTH